MSILLALWAAATALLGLLTLLVALLLVRRQFGRRTTTASKGGGLRVVFVHPDLGIGGAENLVVNAAVALKKKGHTVLMYTAHHDPSHCFAETKPDGVLGDAVFVHGDWLPRSILGTAHVVCSIVRMLYVSLVVVLDAGGDGNGPADVIFCDQISAAVPLLQLCVGGAPVLFYCHFPDKLLCTDRASALKRLYRAPIDWLEEVTTAASDMVVVNSRFTASIFRDAFRSAACQRVSPDVLYPPINVDNFEAPQPGQDTHGAPSASVLGDWANADSIVLLSINRFERKKNVGLAIEALSLLKDERQKNSDLKLPADVRSRLHLVLAGGYDELVTENVEHLAELRDQARDAGLSDAVHFLPSFSDAQKVELLRCALCVTYTPDREHFGIVPIEAMFAGVPVVAVASGGPLETVCDGKTGFLRAGEAAPFANALRQLIVDPRGARKMGLAGHERVRRLFTLDAFGSTLDSYVRQLHARRIEAGAGQGMRKGKGKSKRA